MIVSVVSLHDTPNSAKAERSSIVEEPGEGWTAVREDQRRGTGRFLREKMMSDHGSFFFLRGSQGATNGQDLWGFFRHAQGFGRLDAGSRAGFTSSGPPPPWTSVFQFPLFLYDVWP